MNLYTITIRCFLAVPELFFGVLLSTLSTAQKTTTLHFPIHHCYELFLSAAVIFLL